MSEIKHGRGPNKRHKYTKIINGKYIYPEDLIKKGKKAALTVKDELNNVKADSNYERKIRQKNRGYAVPKSVLEKRAENISRINQRNGKNSKRNKNKYGDNAAGKIANAASSTRRNTVRSNNYGYDRTTEYGRQKMNTANRAAEKAFNSMKMPKIRKVKKSKLSEFKKKLKKVRR